MNSLLTIGSAVVMNDANWSVTHVGDFNGDGRSDLAWRNSVTGQTVLWLMNGATPSTGVVVMNDPAWSVMHVADVNADGKSDLLWRNAGGPTALWLMNGTSPSASVYLAVDPQWVISPPDGL
jgi:hypothetical protein